MTEIINIDHETGDLDEFDSKPGKRWTHAEPRVEAFEHAADGTMTPCHPHIVSGYTMTCMSEELGGRGLIVTDKNFGVGSFSLDPNGMAGVEALYSIETSSASVPYLFRLTLEGVGRHPPGIPALRVEWGGDLGALKALFLPISDEPHLWEIIGKRAKTGISCDGTYEFFVDSVLVDRREKVDNFHSWDLMTVAKYGAMCEFDLVHAIREERIEAKDA